MDLYEVLAVVSFIVVTIMMINQYIDSEVPRVCDVLQIMNILPCYEIKAYRRGRRLRGIDLVNYINKPVQYAEIKDGILYIRIY